MEESDEDAVIETNVIEILLSHVYVYKAGQHRCECGARLHKMSKAEPADWFVAHLAEQITNTVKEARSTHGDQDQKVAKHIEDRGFFVHFEAGTTNVQAIGFSRKIYLTYKARFDNILQDISDRDRTNKFNTFDRFTHSIIDEINEAVSKIKGFDPKPRAWISPSIINPAVLGGSDIAKDITVSFHTSAIDSSFEGHTTVSGADYTRANENPFGIEVVDTITHTSLPAILPSRTARTHKRRRKNRDG